MEVRKKNWRMDPKTRDIFSVAFTFAKTMYEDYNQRVTVRQLYYHLFSKGVIQLTQRDYNRVTRILSQARIRGYLPFEWIEDRSRHPMWDMLYSSPNSFINHLKNQYRKDTWRNQKNFVIILIEKEALAPIVYDIAREYNVFVFPTKGFSSWSMFVIDIRELTYYFGRDKQLVVLTMSDLDPSGMHIKTVYEHKFDFMVKELGFNEPYIEKIAITQEQVKKYNLPPMEKTYRNKGTIKIWELDALDPKILRSIVKESIEKFIDL
ncbi:MAG: hypothetical protein QXO75_02585, partial [Nitrososphaerota archaeon]